MAKYALELNRAAASTTISMGFFQATATTPRRLKVYDWIMGSEAAPGDFAFLWHIRRVTAAGTPAGGTAATPQPLDSADAASLFDATEGTITTDPTVAAASLLAIPLNQRATFRWVAPPDGELKSAATDNVGFAVLTPTAGALVAITSTLQIDEQ